ncbi:hypothetical protein AAEO50_15275 [Rossellomorea oryzaecorticis]|uniref:Uncharacterized protein n=1 Tax=Rossellomorea oryzaecorticis TaxID=1396505 RepID=A0ABU9KC01_9BACI
MAPDRQPKPGIWIYTKEDHPEMFDDEQYDWDKYDMLLWQISDEEMKGKSYKTDSLMLNENEITIKVNFYYGETDPEGKFPRQYLLVEKGILDGKTFKIETIDGEELSLQ